MSEPNVIIEYQPLVVRKYGIERLLSFFEHIFYYGFPIRSALIASRRDIIPAYKMTIKGK